MLSWHAYPCNCEIMLARRYKLSSLFKQSHKTHLVLKFSKLQLHAQVNFQY